MTQRSLELHQRERDRPYPLWVRVDFLEQWGLAWAFKDRWP